MEDELMIDEEWSKRTGRGKGGVVRAAVVILSTILGWAVAPLAAGETPSGASSLSERPPWEWTIEERLEERLDAEQIAARQAAHQLHAAAAEPAEGERVQDPSHYTIRGWEHPHLLLPHEVFRALMTGFDPDPEIRKKQRELLGDALEARGWDEDLFWAQLESVSSRYAALRDTDEDATEEERCRAAFTALESARTLFGRDHFDRFLYEAVAPGMSFSIATNAPDPSQRQRWIANGCR